MIHINAVEAIWLSVNGLALLLTILALLDARHDLRIAGSIDRIARVATAWGNVRREAFRTVVQVLLLSIAVPGIFSDREVTLTWPLVALMAVPVLLLLSSAFDTRDRSRLAALVLEDITKEREAGALEASVQENIQLTLKAIKHANDAFDESNHANEKIADLTSLVADLTRLLGGKEDKPGKAS